MASASQNSATQKASWDETNTAIFLQLLVEQIDAGNRPSGHFTRIAWSTITSKFLSASGCNFTLTQLKNKWDNMKKEFSLWEKLLHEETGLGYDHLTSRIVADPAWWRAKLQEKPEYKKFKVHGPLHLELQEKVFRGVVATGYMEYYPAEDTFLGDPLANGNGQNRIDQESQFEEDVIGDLNMNTEHAPTGDPISSPQNGRQSKRKRTSGSASKHTASEVNRNMCDMIKLMREETASSVRQTDVIADEYGKVIQMLRNLPWIDTDSECFASLLILLEDPTKRVAFNNIIDLGERAITNWIEASKK